MKRLKNWDNKTWLSSKKYINSFNAFLQSKINFNKDMQILDIGCGRGKILGNLSSKLKLKFKPLGIDIIDHKDRDKRISFKKKSASIFFLKNKEKFDLILIKQTVHFFSKTNLNRLLNLAQNSLNPKGKILIFSLKTKNNKIPCFKKMRKNLEKSLKRDEALFKIIKKNLKAISYTNFNFRVNISKQKYVRMLRERYISCLLNMSDKDIKLGISEIKLKYKNQIKFTDTLKCISYRK